MPQLVGELFEHLVPAHPRIQCFDASGPSMAEEREGAEEVLSRRERCGFSSKEGALCVPGFTCDHCSTDQCSTNNPITV